MEKKNICQGDTVCFVLYNIIPLILATLQCDAFYYPHFNKLLRKWKLQEALLGFTEHMENISCIKITQSCYKGLLTYITQVNLSDWLARSEPEDTRAEGEVSVVEGRR